MATSDQALQQAQQNGHVPVYRWPIEKTIEGDEFVFVGPKAFEAMQDAGSCGMSPQNKLFWFNTDADKICDFRWFEMRSMADLPPTVPGKFLKCGITGLSRVVNWRFPELVIVAGPYGMGKSLFAQILAQDFVRQHGLPAFLTCWEDEADEMRDALARYRDNSAHFKTSEERERFLSLITTTIVKRDVIRDMETHFDRVRYQAGRGAKFFVLDPWNSFRHIKDVRQSDTDYVINVLMKAQEIVEELEIIMLITTHVSAEYFDAKGDIKPFKIGNAFGTSQFGNFAHRGFCVLRTDKFTGEQQMVVRQDKVKLEDRVGKNSSGEMIIHQRRMGQRETIVLNYYSEHNSLYWDKETSYSEGVRKIWRN